MEGTAYLAVFPVGHLYGQLLQSVLVGGSGNSKPAAGLEPGSEETGAEQMRAPRQQMNTWTGLAKDPHGDFPEASCPNSECPFLWT